ncbi:Zinc finger, TTF-type [Corchorus olitorius]|uniref:Zinc finger, TTF-type n=1 Tax=Corchorus olitorius TaxID=93759 RepID=A0A1R3FU92_9ROSI|nr:Zinc finger, TTF-type [Corchorus olitorius]
MKSKTIDSFFKKKNTQNLDATPYNLEVNVENSSSQTEVPPSSSTPLTSEARPSKIPRIEPEEIDLLNLEHDPGLRKQIYDYPVNLRDEIQRAYIRDGPHQQSLVEYPTSGSEKNRRRFQATWYKDFWWLEYSPSKDAAFCFLCFLFNNKPTGRLGSTAFTYDGFNNWKKVNAGQDCAFLNHMGRTPSSAHNNAVKDYSNLKNQTQNIIASLDRQTKEQVAANRLRLKASIDVVRWLTFQGYAFRGHDESSSSKNHGNFLELLKLLESVI